MLFIKIVLNLLNVSKYSGTPLVRTEKWPFKNCELSSRLEINTFMFKFTLSSGLSR